MDPSKRRSAETRRANVIYFLNRNGRIEHPHLIRVHHCCQSGVRLRDVKRWMSELRGKEMPDSFAWSYQRRYKNGILWQDLTDDDLITPISDSEYVLLGSLHSAAGSSSPAAAVATASVAAESKPDLLPFSEGDKASEKEELVIEDGISVVPQPADVKPFPEEKVEDGRKSPAGNAGGRSCSWRASHLFCTFISCRVAETDDYAVLNTPHRVIAAAAGDSGGGRRGMRRRRQRSSNWASLWDNKDGGVHRPPLFLPSPN